MTMLEKAAYAAYLAWELAPVAGQPMRWSELDQNQKKLAVLQARAVLMAVREPDFLMEEAGNAALSGNGLDSVEGDDSSVCFVAMIDAILNEGRSA